MADGFADVEHPSLFHMVNHLNGKYSYLKRPKLQMDNVAWLVLQYNPSFKRSWFHRAAVVDAVKKWAYAPRISFHGNTSLAKAMNNDVFRNFWSHLQS